MARKATSQGRFRFLVGSVKTKSNPSVNSNFSRSRSCPDELPVLCVKKRRNTCGNQNENDNEKDERSKSTEGCKSLVD